jgi:hypothetical protein
MAAPDDAGVGAAAPAPHAPQALHTPPEVLPERPIAPRSDLRDAIGWIALGLAVLAGSLAMDRLERQNINPYTVPGLLPGLLGLLVIGLGGVLLLRSLRRGALDGRESPPGALAREERRRIVVTTALCVGYGVVLIGHGLPFWAASAIYVTGSILVLQRMSREAQERHVTLRAAIKAVVIGLAAGAITHLVFQEIFLVRMP